MADYLFNYDDPYKVLAYHIIGFYRPADVVRVLNDDDFIKVLLVKETRGQDMSGAFTDCIIEDILANKDRMEYMGELDKLAKYYYTKLDRERLRAEIKTALGECGIEFSD